VEIRRFHRFCSMAKESLDWCRQVITMVCTSLTVVDSTPQTKKQAEVLPRHSRTGYQDVFLLPGRSEPKHRISHSMLFTGHRSTKTSINAGSTSNSPTKNTYTDVLHRQAYLYASSSVRPVGTTTFDDGGAVYYVN
jgi:hypothetical protein